MAEGSDESLLLLEESVSTATAAASAEPADVSAPNVAEQESVEMTPLGGPVPREEAEGHSNSVVGEGEGNRLGVTVHNVNVQEPSVVFVVKDVTDTDWQRSRYTYSLPLSTAVVDLYSAIAKEAGMCVCMCFSESGAPILYSALGYVENSFLLAWYDKDSDNPDHATPLSPNSTQTLYELDMPSEPQRCYLYLRDGPDAPPVKVADKASGEGTPVGVATGISTTPSSHALNNATSSAWSSTTYYSNKSETGTVHCVRDPPRHHAVVVCDRICGFGESSNDMLPQQSSANTLHDPRIPKGSLQVCIMLKLMMQRHAHLVH